MALPGLYAAESARRSGELVKIEDPWFGPKRFVPVPPGKKVLTSGAA